MADLRSIARRGGIEVLAALARADSLTMAEFEEAAEITAGPARLLRLRLVELGLVDVEEVPVRGASTAIHVRLTPWGREIAKHLAAVADLLERGPPRRR